MLSSDTGTYVLVKEMEISVRKITFAVFVDFIPTLKITQYSTGVYIKLIPVLYILLLSCLISLEV